MAFEELTTGIRLYSDTLEAASRRLLAAADVLEQGMVTPMPDEVMAALRDHAQGLGGKNVSEVRVHIAETMGEPPYTGSHAAHIGGMIKGFVEGANRYAADLNLTEIGNTFLFGDPGPEDD